MQIDLAQHFGLSDNPFRPREGQVDAMAPTSLNQDQARDFIRNRLASAGARRGLFSRAALEEVVSAAGGISHRLRWLAGLAMTEAALEGARTVEQTHVRAAMAHGRIAATPLRAEPAPEAAPIARRSWLPPWAISGLAAATVVVLALLIGVSLVGPAHVNTAPARGAVPHRHSPLSTIARANEAAREPLTIPVASPITARVPASFPAATPQRSEVASMAATDRPIERPRPATEPTLRTSAPLRPSAQMREPLIANGYETQAPALDIVRDTPANDQRAPVSPVRVFIHYLPPDQDAAQDVARQLGDRGWSVAALREVDAVVRQPNTRFFYEDDQRAAADISSDLADTLGEPVRARDMSSYPARPRPGTIEVWLPPQR